MQCYGVDLYVSKGNLRVENVMDSNVPFSKDIFSLVWMTCSVIGTVATSLNSPLCASVSGQQCEQCMNSIICSHLDILLCL